MSASKLTTIVEALIKFKKVSYITKNISVLFIRMLIVYRDAPGCEQVLNGAKLGSNHRWPLWGLQLLALAHWLSTYLYGLLLVSQ